MSSLEGGYEPSPYAWVCEQVAEYEADAVTIQDGPKPFAVRVRELTGDERTAWWERAVAAYPPTPSTSNAGSG